MEPTNEQRVCIKFCANLGPFFPGLSLVIRAVFTVMTLRQSSNRPLPMGNFKLTETKNGETGEEQSQEHAHHCL
jgi:hypothetical protein